MGDRFDKGKKPSACDPQGKLGRDIEDIDDTFLELHGQG
jgi:hypothetical protein